MSGVHLQNLTSGLERVQADGMVTEAERADIRGLVADCCSAGVDDADIDRAFQAAGLERPAGEGRR